DGEHRHFNDQTVVVDQRATRAVCDDKNFKLTQQITDLLVGFLAQHFRFIGIDDEDVRTADDRAQLVTVKSGNLLAGVGHEADVACSALICQLYHRFRVVGGDDDQIGRVVVDIGHRIIFCVGHRASIKRRNLVVIEVGVDEERGGEYLINLAHGAGIHSGIFQPQAVVRKVTSNSSHQVRAQAQHRSIKGDIGCDTAPVFGHVVHKETDADLVKLIADKVIGKATGESHQIVIGD